MQGDGVAVQSSDAAVQCPSDVQCTCGAVQVVEQCSVTARAMLLGCKSNAFGMQEQCFWMLGAMLLASESNAKRQVAVSSFWFLEQRSCE